MKFHGIDMQGRYLVEEAAAPSWIGADDRRIVRNSVDGRLLLGTATGWDEIVLASQGLPSDFEATLDTVYHTVGGSTTESFIVSTITGDGTDHLRVTDDWVKISDDTPLVPGGEAGIKVELSTTGSDADDASLYYHVGVDPADSGWWLDDAISAPSLIATQDWVTDAISGNASLTWTDQQIDNRFVRYSTEGDITTNDTWSDWAELADDVLGSSRIIYRTAEAWNGFVRSSSWAINSPATRPIYSTSANVQSTVVERDSSSNIYCNILYGTATAAQYADLAEVYICDESLPVGTVVGVMIDSDYEVEPFSSDFMHGVIGVVSDSPAYLMNADSDGLPIALTGKVPVRVVGMVDKGDFLVPLDGGIARKGDPKSEIDRGMKFATVLEDCLQKEEKMVMCIIK